MQWNIEKRNLIIPDSSKQLYLSLSCLDRPLFKNIRILHECEVLIENSVIRVTVWHHEAPPNDAKL